MLIVAEVGSVFGKEKNASHSALHKHRKLSALHVAAKRAAWVSISEYPANIQYLQHF